MRRKLLLLAGLTAAVAIAVLLRTASPAAGQLAVTEPVQANNTPIAEVAVADCSIATERTPGLIASEAAQPLPLVPLDAADRTFVVASDQVRAAPALLLEVERPAQQHLFAPERIRPPPLSHAA